MGLLVFQKQIQARLLAHHLDLPRHPVGVDRVLIGFDPQQETDAALLKIVQTVLSAGYSPTPTLTSTATLTETPNPTPTFTASPSPTLTVTLTSTGTATPTKPASGTQVAPTKKP